MNIKVLSASGYCNGVKNAIRVALTLRNDNPDKKIIILGELVHNEFTTNKIKENNIEVIDLPYDEIIFYLSNNYDNNAIYLACAHGHYHDLDELIKKYNLTIVDATCPIVKRINKNLESLPNDIKIYYFGKKGHSEQTASFKYLAFKNSEFIDIKTEFDPILENENEVIITNQSTVDLAEFEEKIVSKYPNIKINKLDNFCPILKERMKIVEENLDKYDVFITIGSKHSSNANELFNLTKTKCKECYFIDSIDELTSNIINSIKNKKVAIISATSTSDEQIEIILNYLNNFR